MFSIISVAPLPDYRLHLRFEDGAEGEVDLSRLVGKGVFAVWQDVNVFAEVEIGTGGELCWPGDVDLCPDALYLEVTGKSPAELFPQINPNVHA